MAINLQRTSALSTDGIKMLAYGQAGAGKTSLIPTLPSPIVLSAEAGLLSIAGADIPFINVSSMDDAREVYEWLTQSDEAKQYQSVAIDSISEIAQVCLATEKKKTVSGKKVDPRQAYGEMTDTVTELVRAFRDVKGKHIYMTAKLEKAQDEMGRMLYAPMMPGNKAGQDLPYQFDIIAAMRVEKDAEGVTQRALMLESDGLWSAKHRFGGKLDAWEAPDLGAIISKIGGV